MSPATAPEPPPIVVSAHSPKLSHEEIARVMEEPNGASALLVMLRNDRVDVESVIDAITRMQDQPSSKIKRFLVTLLDTLIPG